MIKMMSQIFNIQMTETDKFFNKIQIYFTKALTKKMQHQVEGIAYLWLYYLWIFNQPLLKQVYFKKSVVKAVCVWGAESECQRPISRNAIVRWFLMKVADDMMILPFQKMISAEYKMILLPILSGIFIGQNIIKSFEVKLFLLTITKINLQSRHLVKNRSLFSV